VSVLHLMSDLYRTDVSNSHRNGMYTIGQVLKKETNFQ